MIPAVRSTAPGRSRPGRACPLSCHPTLVASIRRRLIHFATGVAAVATFLVLAVTLWEPRLGGTPSTPAPDEVVGVVHVHTDASDGGGTLGQVLDAANGLGLDFVVLTDHNVRGAPAWEYRDSVLLIVGEEVNTPYGHLLVVGDQPVGDRRGRAPGERPPGSTGSPPDSAGTSVAPSVQPHEGLRIVAHPTGKPRWTAWDGAQFDGIEIWNADTERRNDALGEWLVAASLLPLRPLAGLYRLLDHPEEALGIWDRLQQDRPVFGVCSVDAHHTLPLNRSRSLDLHFPTYRHSFQMARQHVMLEAPLSGNAVEDGRRILSAIRAGRSYCAFDGLADGRGASFAVTSGQERIDIGGGGTWRPGAEIRISLPASGPETTSVRVIRDGEVFREEPGPSLTISLPGPGTYRVEVLLERNRTVPWILTNPFHLSSRESVGSPSG